MIRMVRSVVSRVSSAYLASTLCTRLLVLVFLLTLPAVNPWIRGDGVGYYAYLRAPLIEHSLNFENDWRAANPSFSMNRVDPEGRPHTEQYTSTGHLGNLFSVGPAMLWAPPLSIVHVSVLAFNKLGAHILADGFSLPYRLAAALATATYGFLGLYLSFRLARKYFEERWAFLATLGIWFASALPVYMYFNPFWSHAHSAFVAALFLWYWDRTRTGRTLRQWVVLGVLAGMVCDVYYVNGVLLLVPGVETLVQYFRALRQPHRKISALGGLAVSHSLFALTALLVFLPTFITRTIIFGSPLRFAAYTEMYWNWTSPVFWDVLFSSFHGLFTWTPLLLPASLGVFLLWRRDSALAAPLSLAFSAFYYVICSYPYWHGMSSFGNRFFISMTPLFVVGLSAVLESLGRLLRRGRLAFASASALIGLFALWNAGFIFQWGTHLVPARGPISWREMVHNQFSVVPETLERSLRLYFSNRKTLMEKIEREDVNHLKCRPPADQ